MMLYDSMYNFFNILLYSLFQKLLICWPINTWHLLKDKLRLDHKSMTWKSYLTLWVHFWAFLHRMLDDLAEYEFISMEQVGGCINFAISAKVIWTKKHSGFPLGKNLNCFSDLMISNILICVVQSLSHVRLFETRWMQQPGFPVLHHLLELAQTHVLWVGEAIQSSCPLSSLSPPTFKSFPASRSFLMSWVLTSDGQSIGASASVLPMNIQGWFPLAWTGLIFLQSKGLSRVFSSTTVQKHQFFGVQPSLWSNSHNYTWLLEKL